METATIERRDDKQWYKDNPYIVTYTGKKFYFLDPTPEMIDIRDIAHALSNMCRFGGHTNQFYSVAQHSIHVSMYSDDTLSGLLHDATEAYLVDIPKPIKGFLTNYVEMEDKLYKAIADKFGVPDKIPEDVKEADVRMLFTEKQHLCANVDWGWEVEPYRMESIICLSPIDAEDMFLKYFHILTKNKFA